MTLPAWNMNQIVGTTDIALIVFDTLRYDVAVAEFAAGNTPCLAQLCPTGWQKRHSPGSFTYAAHHAFFAGFLPTPADASADRQRLFATSFEGSETIGPKTKVFATANIIAGFREEGYHTLCLGGVGFFNRRTPLSCVFPDWFDESYWSEDMGVTALESTLHQIRLARQCFEQTDPDRKIFFFLNISAIHQPNHHYLAGKEQDDLETHAAALRYVDSCLPDLLDIFRDRGDTFIVACSDHGTLYGEEGFVGHRVGHEAVFTVPYLETWLPGKKPSI